VDVVKVVVMVCMVGVGRVEGAPGWDPLGVHFKAGEMLDKGDFCGAGGAGGGGTGFRESLAGLLSCQEMSPDPYSLYSLALTPSLMAKARSREGLSRVTAKPA
jgi:hypothetical protein